MMTTPAAGSESIKSVFARPSLVPELPLWCVHFIWERRWWLSVYTAQQTKANKVVQNQFAMQIRRWRDNLKHESDFFKETLRVDKK